METRLFKESLGAAPLCIPVSEREISILKMWLFLASILFWCLPQLAESIDMCPLFLLLWFQFPPNEISIASESRCFGSASRCFAPLVVEFSLSNTWWLEYQVQRIIVLRNIMWWNWIIAQYRFTTVYIAVAFHNYVQRKSPFEAQTRFDLHYDISERREHEFLNKK